MNGSAYEKYRDKESPQFFEEHWQMRDFSKAQRRPIRRRLP